MGGSGSKIGEVIADAGTFGMASRNREKTKQASIAAEQEDKKRAADAKVLEQEAAKEAAQQESSRQIAQAVASRGPVVAEKGKFGTSDDEDKLKTRQTVLGRG